MTSDKLIELTYYNPVMEQENPQGKRLVYYHNAINVRPDQIKWMINNYKSIHLGQNGKYKMSKDTTQPNTLMFIEGLGRVFVKNKRVDIKKKIEKEL